MTVGFITLGCKVNQYDSQAMLERFEAHGYSAAAAGETADIYVVNTCTVTGTGDQKSMQLVRRMQRKNPNAELIITGCLAQRMGEELRATGARLILGTQYRAEIVTLFERARAEGQQLVAVEKLESAPYEPLHIQRHEGHTRAVMKIQEGCDNHCTYCIIPSVRGGVRSRDMGSIRTEAMRLAEAGFCEIVLTGIHLTSYGRDLESRPSLADAVSAVCEQEGIARVRLGSLEPRVVNEAFVRQIKAMPKLCPQFHLALQSGSDTVLARMKRGYNTSQFWEAAERLKAAYPEAAITTDVIVGFPGETEEEFMKTLSFCERIGFAKIHVFPYSQREGTPAASMPGQTEKSVKDERVRALIALGNKLADAYRRRQIGTFREILIEKQVKTGKMEGYTPEYIHTEVPGGAVGQIVRVRLATLTKEGMAGSLVE